MSTAVINGIDYKISRGKVFRRRLDEWVLCTKTAKSVQMAVLKNDREEARIEAEKITLRMGLVLTFVDKRYKIVRMKGDLVTVKFDSGWTETVTRARAKTGYVRDCLARSVSGVGFIGGTMYTPSNDHYKAWTMMIFRCYGPASKNPNSKYFEQTVCEDWQNFQLFSQWYLKQGSEGKKNRIHLKENANVYRPGAVTIRNMEK